MYAEGAGRILMGGKLVSLTFGSLDIVIVGKISWLTLKKGHCLRTSCHPFGHINIGLSTYYLLHRV